MNTQTGITSINDKLSGYQRQLIDLCQALDAVRGTADRIAAAIGEDRVLIAGWAKNAEHETSLADATRSTIVPDSAVDTSIAKSSITAFGPPILISALPAVEIAEDMACSIDADADDATSGASADVAVLVASLPALAAQFDDIDAAVHASIAAIEIPAGHVAITAETDVTAAQAVSKATTATAGTLFDAAPREKAPEPTAEVAATGIVPEHEISTPEPLPVTAATADALAAVSLAAATAAAALKGDSVTTANANAAVGGATILDLASRREARKAASPLKRRTLAIVASLLLVAATAAGMHELLQTEIGQRLLDLGTCDGETLSVNRNCAVLAWLLL